MCVSPEQTVPRLPPASRRCTSGRPMRIPPHRLRRRAPYAPKAQLTRTGSDSEVSRAWRDRRTSPRSSPPAHRPGSGRRRGGVPEKHATAHRRRALDRGRGVARVGRGRHVPPPASGLPRGQPPRAAGPMLARPRDDDRRLAAGHHGRPLKQIGADAPSAPGKPDWGVHRGLGQWSRATCPGEICPAPKSCCLVR